METNTPDHAALVVELILLVFQVNGRLLERGDELVAPINLSSARWQVLGAVALAGKPLTAPQIAEVMRISRQGAQKQLNRMLQEGLVERQPNPRHERSPLYLLTPAGEHAYQRAMALNEVWVARLGESFTRAELQATLTGLSRLLEQLSSPVPTPE